METNFLVVGLSSFVKAKHYKVSLKDLQLTLAQDTHPQSRDVRLRLNIPYSKRKAN